MAASAGATGKVDPNLTQRFERTGTVYTAPRGSGDAAALPFPPGEAFDAGRAGNRSPLGDRKVEVHRSSADAALEDEVAPSQAEAARSTERESLLHDQHQEKDVEAQPQTCWQKAAAYCCCCFGTKPKDE